MRTLRNAWQHWTKIQQNKERKQSRFSALLAMTTLNQPVWTPAQYDALSDVGYQKNVIVYRSVNLIARSIASVPWLLYQRENEIDHHPLLSLLNRPNPLQGGNDFMENAISYLLLSGNSYLESVALPGSPPQELHVLRPDRMRIVPGAQGLPDAYEYSVFGRSRRIAVDPLGGASPILHIKLFHPLNDWYGLSPLEAALKSIDLHNTVAHHNLALLQNGGRPSGALLVKPNPKTGIPLSDAQRKDLRENLQEVCQGTRNAGQLMILEGDFDWKEMGLSPKDMDFVEGKNISAREIAQIFGVPPMLVGVPGDATFSNYREAQLHLWEDTILPLLDRIVNQFNLWLTPQFGEDLSLAYDTDAIPTLAAKREAAWEKIDRCSFLTLNEKRQAVGYAPPQKWEYPSVLFSTINRPMKVSPMSRISHTFNIPFEIKNLATSGNFSGYASTYGIDSQRDQIMPGAFSHSLKQWEQKGKLPLLLWHHRIDEPIGFWKQISEDEKGLYVEGQLIMDLQRAREAYTLIKSKILEGLSIGFQSIISRFDPAKQVRKIYQVNLMEISVVSFPANEEAYIRAVKTQEYWTIPPGPTHE